MKNIYLILKVACVVLLMGACTPEEFEQFDNSTVHQDWPLAMNRTGHVVDSVVWYETEENHTKCIYEYDQNNRLKKRTLYITILEQGQVKNKMYVDTLEYDGDRLQKIRVISCTDPYHHSDQVFFYDEEGRLIRSEYEDNVMCFAYRNGCMDSVYFPSDPEMYILLYYDTRGNVVRTLHRLMEYDMLGQPTGRYYTRMYEYEYDNNQRPNFNVDNAFMYEPLFGQGSSYYTFVRMISPNNMTRYSAGPEIWEYEYNERGLPTTMYHQFADVVPTYHPVFRFTYRAVE